ncbi:uncharacterized protein IWZ02DRAFT_65631 [Phyllosticta citriasiana]|uniref:uncharacterized protein n=1 Tax=Phyllosticta citriasiana TaxID=595635 RepID=UPI0030FD6C32
MPLSSLARFLRGCCFGEASQPFCRAWVGYRMDLRCELLVTSARQSVCRRRQYACLLHVSHLKRDKFSVLYVLYQSSPLFRICSAVSNLSSISFFSVANRSAPCPISLQADNGCGFAPLFAFSLLLFLPDARLSTPHAHFRALETCTIRCSCPVSRLWQARLLLVQIPSQKPLQQTKRGCHSSKHLSLNQRHQLVWR